MRPREPLKRGQRGLVHRRRGLFAERIIELVLGHDQADDR
jgi:hypothetical protein